MAGCTFSYLVLQVISFNVHIRGGKKNTHKKSITEHSRLSPSKLNWAPTAIPEGYSDLERTRKTKNLTPLPVFWQTHTLSTCQKVTAPNGVFLVEFSFFHYGSPSPHLPIPLQIQPNLEGTEKLLTSWAKWQKMILFLLLEGEMEPWSAQGKWLHWSRQLVVYPGLPLQLPSPLFSQGFPIQEYLMHAQSMWVIPEFKSS